MANRGADTILAPGFHLFGSPVDVPQHVEVGERGAARNLAQGCVHGQAETARAKRDLRSRKRRLVYIHGGARHVHHGSASW
jgi:hypothetical protein